MFYNPRSLFHMTLITILLLLAACGTPMNLTRDTDASLINNALLENTAQAREALLQNPDAPWKSSILEHTWLTPLINEKSKRVFEHISEKNHALLAARKAMLIAEINYQTNKRQDEPSMNVLLTSLRSGNSINTDTQYQLELNLQWDLDIWNILNLRSRQAYLAILNSYQNYQQQMHTTFHSFFSQYLNYQLAQEKLALLDQRLEKLNTQALTIEDNYLHGVGHARAILQSRSDLQRLSIEKIALTAESARIQENITQLLADQVPASLVDEKAANTEVLFTGDWKNQRLDWDMMSEITLLPATWNIATLAYNPSIQQSWLNLLSADAELAIAQRNRLPQLTLNSSGAYSSMQWRELISSDTLFWTLVGGITQPLFQQRRLSSIVKEKSATVQRQEVLYLENLGNSLKQLRQYSIVDTQLHQQITSINNLLQAKQLETVFALQDYLQGISDYESLLTVQRTVLEIKKERLETIALIFENRLNIFSLIGAQVPLTINQSSAEGS